MKTPTADWENIWRRARLQGLGSGLTSFLFKLLHQLLITQERLARTNNNVSPMCKAPGCPGNDVEDLVHALIKCPSNNGVGQAVFDCIASNTTGLTEEQALRLDFALEDQLEFPATWILGNTFLKIWEIRCANKHPELYTVRADLEAKVSLLRETRHHTNDVVHIVAMIDQL